MKWCVPLCLHGLWFGIPCEASARSREADSDQVRYRFNGLGRGVPPQLVSEQEIFEWLIEEIGVVEEMIQRKALSAPAPPVAVPPGDGETVHVVPVPPRVEVPFVAPVPPPPPVLLTEEPVMQVEKFLRLQPPSYSGGPNPDIAEHWVHEIERVFATMRCPAADKVVLAAYQLRGLRVELQDAIVPLMCKTVEEAAQRAAMLERSIRTRQVGESGSGSFRLPQQLVGASKGKAPIGPSSSGFGKWGQKLKQAFKGKGRGWGGRQQFQQGRGRPEVEESQQSTARQPITPPGYRCYNCNQPGHLIRNCPYLREYGYGRGVQQQQQPQQFQQPQAVALNGRGVDANLCNLQVIGSPEGRFSTWFFLSLALASCPRIPKASNSHRRVVGGSWNVWHCRIRRGNIVATCNLHRSLRRARREPGIFRIDLGFLQEQRLKILASASIVAKFISRDTDDHIPCRLLPISGSRCCRYHVYR
ncbi:hypothetical protein Taro_026209 [Colocasia esculenta]|uniref:CCHC-type domain-containing protein n=1 Tax=Colocasia esculenta TaxID=4460 RepID=A0A843VQN0_COLES|nr:hypothetical protein [Colocasia esculenta]